MSKSLSIGELRRIPESGKAEVLEFHSGVNLICGEGNTGKTVWLKMLDYLLGDTGSAEDCFGVDLEKKYREIAGEIKIGEQDFTVVRRWKKKGQKHKIFINDNPVRSQDFSDFILNELKIETLCYPKGNPFSGRAWPRLTWRSLFRHVYRQQRFWSDIADKQPEGEQHACLTHFLGIAESLYTSDYHELVLTRQQLFELEGAKKSFVTIVSRLFHEMFPEQSDKIVVDISKETIQTKIEQVKAEAAENVRDLETAFDNSRKSIKESNESDVFFDLTSAKTQFLKKKAELKGKIDSVNQRLAEMTEYAAILAHQISALSKFERSVKVLSPLKITNCPACDREVSESLEVDNCFLCKRPHEEKFSSCLDSGQRFELEKKRLKREQQEVTELLSLFNSEKRDLIHNLKRIELEISSIEVDISPYRKSANAIFRQGPLLLEFKRGKYTEQIRQLDKIQKLLDSQDEVEKEIERLSKKAARVEKKVDSHLAGIEYLEKTEPIIKAMNEYVDSLATEEKKVWKQQAISLDVMERRFSFTVGGKKWNSKLGGNMTYLFLLAYQYGLLSLSGFESNFPGLTIIDFPPKLESGASLSDHESNMIKPFLDLTTNLKKKKIETQVIVAGNSFEGLKKVNRLMLTKVWV